jgi:5-methylcytosine-specific restriction endonuclease McrA
VPNLARRPQAPVKGPDRAEVLRMRRIRVVLAAAHLDHDRSNNRLGNLKSLCQRCHRVHDRLHHVARRRMTHWLRRARGDLVLGPYKPI